MPHPTDHTLRNLPAAVQSLYVALYCYSLFFRELLLEQGTVTHVYRNGTKLALNNLEDE